MRGDVVLKASTFSRTQHLLHVSLTMSLGDLHSSSTDLCPRGIVTTADYSAMTSAFFGSLLDGELSRFSLLRFVVAGFTSTTSILRSMSQFAILNQ